MLIYYVLIVLWIAYYAVCKEKIKNKRKRNVAVAIGLGISVFLLGALRAAEVGTDTETYLIAYQKGNDHFFKGVEFGYYLYRTLFYNLHFTNQMYLAIVALTCVFCYTKFFIKYSNNTFYSYFLHLTIGLLPMSMSGIRQSLAICITLFAYDYILKKDLVRFLIIVGIATLFHQSACIFFIVYIFRFIKFDKLKFSAFWIAAIFAAAFSKEIFMFALKLSPFDYSIYFSDYFKNTSVNFLVILIAVLIPLVCNLFAVRANMDEREIIIFRLAQGISCMYALFCILTRDIQIAGRLSFYFMSANLILIPNTIETIRIRSTKIWANIACVILPLFQFIISIPGNSIGIDQYSFFW
jgi:hypothetical protein